MLKYSRHSRMGWFLQTSDTEGVVYLDSRWVGWTSKSFLVRYLLSCGGISKRYRVPSLDIPIISQLLTQLGFSWRDREFFILWNCCPISHHPRTPVLGTPETQIKKTTRNVHSFPLTNVIMLLLCHSRNQRLPRRQGRKRSRPTKALKRPIGKLVEGGL